MYMIILDSSFPFLAEPPRTHRVSSYKHPRHQQHHVQHTASNIQLYYTPLKFESASENKPSISTTLDLSASASVQAEATTPAASAGSALDGF